MRARYQAMSTEERRAMTARRDPEKVKASDAARYYRDWDKRRAAMDKYTREHQEQVATAKRQWKERNPDKAKAQWAANNAVRDGKLTRQPCEVCGSTERVQKHHDDYSKPLEVRWFCPKHHGKHHRKY